MAALNQPTPVKADEQQGRVFVGETITVAYLVGLFNEPGRTSFQARTLVEPYIGKWMKVSGVMKDVMRTNVDQKFVQMVFERDPSIEYTHPLFYAQLTMYFRNDWIQRVLILKVGDQLTVIGQIDRVDRISLQLENCELVQSQSA